MRTELLCDPLFNGGRRPAAKGEFSAVFKMRNAKWKTVLTTGARPVGGDATRVTGR
jgi:hypothetical protein